MRLLAAFLLPLVYFICLIFWGNPVWETNDDVAMAMVAHGYGFVAHPSPNLLFSNVVWGHIVQALHGTLGLQGYSIGTLGALFLSALSCLYFLTRLGVTYWISLPVLTTIFTWSILVPQFTVNAGLLSIAGILGLYTYAKTRNLVELIIGCILVVLGFLIRPLEFALVLTIATPFLPWRLLRERRFRLACLATLLAIITAYAIDKSAYQSSEWQQFSLENSARAPYTDFGIGAQLKRHPGILQSYGYSDNDIDILSNWFFVDRNIFSPQSLNGMIASLGPSAGPLSISRLNFDAGLSAFERLFVPRLLPLTIAAAILFVMFFNLSLAASWMLFFLSLFGLGLVGANVQTRVICPALALLIVMPLAWNAPIAGRRFRTVLASASMLAIAAYSAHLLQPVVSSANARYDRAQQQIQALGQRLLFVWGDAFDFEGTFPVKLSFDKIASSPPLFALGVMTFAPFSVAVSETKMNRGLVDRLQTSTGISIFTYETQIALLKTYCRERLGAELRSVATDENLKQPTLHQLNCLK